MSEATSLHHIQALVCKNSVTAAPHPIQLPINGLGKAQKMFQKFGSTWETWKMLLALGFILAFLFLPVHVRNMTQERDVPSDSNPNS